MTVQSWLQNKQVLAVRFPGETGMFQQNRTVPAGTIAYLPHPDATPSLRKTGDPVPAGQEAVLVKTGEFPISLSFDGMTSQDDYDVNTSVTIHVRVGPEEVSLEGFYDNIMSRLDTCDIDTIQQYLEYPVKKQLSSVIADNKIKQLREFDGVEQIEQRLESNLSEIFFTRGLEYRSLGQLDFNSEAYEQERKRQREKRDRILSHEQDLQEQKRKEEKLEQVLDMLRTGTGEQLVSEIPDARVKGLLYKSVVEDNLLQEDPEEAGHRLSDRLDRDAYEVLVSALNDVGGGTSDNPFRVETVPETLCQDLFLAAGKKLIRIRPDRPGEPRETVTLESPVRSVRIESVQGTERILAGSRSTVYMFDEDLEKPPKTYTLPPRDDVRGGVNAATVVGEQLVSTHSEYGVVAWNLDEPGEGRPVHNDLTESARTTRAVLADARREGYYFLSGPYVCYSDWNNQDAEKLAPVLPAAGTDLSRGEKGLYASFGHRSTGGVAGWIPETSPSSGPPAPGSFPEEGTVMFQQTSPVSSLDLLQIAGVPCLLYSRGDSVLVARMLGSNLENTYNISDLELTLGRGGSDRIFGLDSSGRYLVLWNNDTQDEPEEIVDCMTFSNHPVLDLAIRPRS